MQNNEIKKCEVCGYSLRGLEIVSLCPECGADPKAAKPKIYKVTRKNINDDKNNFVVRFKNLDKEQVKQLRVELQDVVDHFFETQEPHESRSEY